MPHPGGIQRLYRPRADLSALAHRKWMPSVNVTGGLNCMCNTDSSFAETDVTLSAFHVWHSDRPAGAKTSLQPLHRGTTFTERAPLICRSSLSLSLITPPTSDGRGSEEGSGLSPWGPALKGKVFLATFTVPTIGSPNGARPPVFCRMSSSDKRRFFLILSLKKNKKKQRSLKYCRLIFEVDFCGWKSFCA